MIRLEEILNNKKTVDSQMHYNQEKIKEKIKAAIKVSMTE